MTKRITSLEQLYQTINDTRLYKNFILREHVNSVINYVGDDWRKYINFSDRTYTRRILKEYSNDMFEFVLICWNNDQYTPIHDHPERGCIMKVLEGGLWEHRYTKCCYGNYDVHEKSYVVRNDVTYIEGNDTIHKIINDNLQTVTLHIYSPAGYINNTYDHTKIKN